MSTLLRTLALAGLIGGFILPASAQAPAPARPAAAAPPAPAAPRGPLPTPVIAVVDTQAIQEQTSVMKSFREQMQKEDQTIRADLTKRESDLRGAEKDLQQQRSLLSADAFAEKRRSFETQVGEFERYAAARKRQFETAYNDGMRQVDQAMNGVLREIAQERGLNLIMPRGALMLLADNNLDITDDVKRRLDNRLKSVSIKLPPLQK